MVSRGPLSGLLGPMSDPGVTSFRGLWRPRGWSLEAEVVFKGSLGGLSVAQMPLAVPETTFEIILILGYRVGGVTSSRGLWGPQGWSLEAWMVFTGSMGCPTVPQRPLGGPETTFEQIDF